MKNQSSEVDALGGKPLSLNAALRFVESELHKFRKLKEQGHEMTIPESTDDDGNIIEPVPIDERIADLETMLSYLKGAATWAEATRPGSSKSGNGGLVIKEYAKATGNRI